jgi:hypothetical protein
LRMKVSDFTRSSSRCRSHGVVVEMPLFHEFVFVFVEKSSFFDRMERKQRTYSSLLNPSFDFSTKSRSKPVFVLCGEKKKKKRVSESASAAFSSRLKTQNIKSVSPMWLLLH